MQEYAGGVPRQSIVLLFFILFIYTLHYTHPLL